MFITPLKKAFDIVASWIESFVSCLIYIYLYCCFYLIFIPRHYCLPSFSLWFFIFISISISILFFFFQITLQSNLHAACKWSMYYIKYIIIIIMYKCYSNIIIIKDAIKGNQKKKKDERKDKIVNVVMIKISYTYTLYTYVCEHECV